MSKNAVNNFYNISLFCQVTLSGGKETAEVPVLRDGKGGQINSL
jgi:hypothetical protein